MEQELKPNEGKNGVTCIDGISYQRLPIKTGKKDSYGTRAETQ